MTGWNLPPGVNESMLPGNRPEDQASEEFWMALENQLIERGVEPADLERLQGAFVLAVLEVARDLGYTAGYNDGLIEAKMGEGPPTWEVLDAARGPLYGPKRVVLAGPYENPDDAEYEARQWAGATDPRVVSRET
jgi:hypothetical protein